MQTLQISYSAIFSGLYGQSAPADIASIEEPLPPAQLLRAVRDEAIAIRERQSPTEFPRIAGLECFGENRRAGGPGGDFFDVVAPNCNELVIGLGTLPAKEMSAPILLSGLQATMHSLAARGSELATVVAELNAIMWNIAPERTFASLFSARVLPRSRGIHYVNAGHEAALVIRACGRVERLEPHGPVLGLSRLSQYRPRTIAFEPGDTLIALSEGAEPGAQQVVAGNGSLSAAPKRLRDLPRWIVDTAESVSGYPAIDRTVVIVRYLRERGGQLDRIHESVSELAAA